MSYDDDLTFVLRRSVQLTQRSGPATPSTPEPERKVVQPPKPRRDESIEPGRLRRAIDLVPFVEQKGPQDFIIVRKGYPDYPVSLTTDPSCYCKDTEYRGLICKHTLACRLRIFEKGAVQAWADIVEVRERQKKERRRKRTA